MNLTQEQVANDPKVNFENQIEMFQVLEQLQDMCWAWINADPSRTKLSLANQVGVSEATVRRVLNDKRIPNSDNLMKFVRYFGNGNRVGDSIDRRNGAIADHLANQLPMSKWQNEKDYRKSGQELAIKLNSNMKQLLYLKAIVQEHGLSVNEILKDFGSEGIAEATELIQDEILVFENQAYHLHEDSKSESKKVIFSQRVSKEILSTMIQKYYKINQHNNVGFWHIGSVSNEGYLEIQAAIKDCLQRVEQITTEKAGDIPVFTVGLTDTLSFESRVTN